VRCSRAHAVSFTERPESSHRLLAWRSHLLCGEKMEERLEAPSVVSNPLPASADPHGLSAVHTQRLAAPDRAIRLAVPVTFGHDACAPFRSAAGPSASHSAARTPLPFSTWLRRPSRRIRFRDALLPSVSAALAGCDGLTHPPAVCLSTVRGA